MSHFICPICQKELLLNDNSYSCENRHSFDKARSGYINLLPSSRMNSKTPGDSKEMVGARRTFLEKGYYGELRSTLASTAKALAPKNPIYLDAGCGTGYYTSEVASTIDSPLCLGVDISKFAVDAAAKREKSGLFAVASVYDLPIPSDCVDIITNVFSPMADSEYLRVLKKGGYLLYVVPAPRHLFSLKQVLYATPYENEEIYPEYEGFEEVQRIDCAFDIKLASSKDIEALFTMTPYFWRTPTGALEKIRALDTLETRAEFYISVLRKS